MNMKEQPFYIGQRVVALTTDKVDSFRLKGKIYIVMALNQCPKCKGWFVDIGDRLEMEKGVDGFMDNCRCGYAEETKSTIWWHESSAFAPLQEGFQSITFEKVLETELTSVN